MTKLKKSHKIALISSIIVTAVCFTLLIGLVNAVTGICDNSYQTNCNNNTKDAANQFFPLAEEVPLIS